MTQRLTANAGDGHEAFEDTVSRTDEDTGGSVGTSSRRMPAVIVVCREAWTSGGSMWRGRAYAAYAFAGIVAMAILAAPAVAQEGPPTASIEITNLVGSDQNAENTGALLPLHDWVPLFAVTITSDDDPPATRFGRRLDFTIEVDAEDRDYVQLIPLIEDIREIGIFANFQSDPDDDAIVLDSFFIDNLIHIEPVEAENEGGDVAFENEFGGGVSITFPDLRQLPTPFALINGAGAPSDTIIIAMRPSAVLRSGVSFRPRVLFFDAVDEFGVVPRNEEGDPIDSIPEFPVENENAYSSSFSVFDATGSPVNVINGPDEPNVWNHIPFIYTPFDEHLRPRFDLPGNTINFVTGEWMYNRTIPAQESWFPVIKINAHALPGRLYDQDPRVDVQTSAPEFDSPLPLPEEIAGIPFAPKFRAVDGDDNLISEIREVNVVLTDIGADPFGPPGNGGFDPRLALERFTGRGTRIFDAGTTTAIGLDYSFNGVWLFEDTNNNGFFDIPTANADGGATLTDVSMIPDFLFNVTDPDEVLDALGSEFLVDAFEPGFEYIPFPPGGGDPWWKVRLRFAFGARTESIDELRGLEITPDVLEDQDGDTVSSELVPDYFVVIRPDSGFQDISGIPGDGTGIRPGADFRAFIEPRRFNSFSNNFDGGILFASQSSSDGTPVNSAEVITPWQSDRRWDELSSADEPNVGEPWWHERTIQPIYSKPVRSGFEIHNYVMTYNSNNELARAGNVFYSGFDAPLWLDPFGIKQEEFYFEEEPFLRTFVILGGTSLLGFPTAVDDSQLIFQFPYETAPFFNSVFDTPPLGPRSSFYALPNIRSPETIPTFDTWLPFQTPPSSLPAGEYPSASNWQIEDRTARLLRQRIPTLSRPTAMLGFNFSGVDDPFVFSFANQRLQEITVAFVGDDFTPDDLLPLDPNGVSPTSGVALLEDQDGDGEYRGLSEIVGADTPLPLEGLRWEDAPESLDLDGDGVADDLDGDGDVDENDVGWVLVLRPQSQWPIPASDIRTAPTSGSDTGQIGSGYGEGREGFFSKNAPGLRAVNAEELDAAPKAAWSKRQRGKSVSTKEPVLVDLDAVQEQVAAKSRQQKVLAAQGSIGDDLFLIIRTSPNLKRFEEFRAIVPATLPEREGGFREAGVRIFPRVDFAPDALDIRNTEENPVQDYFGVENIIASISTTFVSLTDIQEQIRPNDTIPVVGVASRTNRGCEAFSDFSVAGIPDNGEGNEAEGGGNATFVVDNAGWALNEHAGFFLIDSRYVSWEIASNSADTLTLLSQLEGAGPADGPWLIVKDPSFLEELTLEFYDVGNDGDFEPRIDLLPLQIENPEEGQFSGIALYRDNRFDEDNRLGVFDPDIDIPVELDYPPFRVGVEGEPGIQYKLVFSSPGTDDAPVLGANRGLELQPSRRQWVPDYFANVDEQGILECAGERPDLFLAEETQNDGPNFFIVVRTSPAAQAGDDFQIGLVSWGPPTPSAPDPDTFPPGLAEPDEFELFNEFPWGSRAIGYVTMFKDPPDPSGLRFIRTQASRAVATSVITINPALTTPVVIDNVNPREVPSNPQGGLLFQIAGSGLGANPQVLLDGIPIPITSVDPAGTFITLTLPDGITFAGNFVVLTVQNPATGDSATRADLISVFEQPQITGTSIAEIPRERAGDITITIFGAEFGADPLVRLTDSEGFDFIFNPDAVSSNDEGTEITVVLEPDVLLARGPLELTVTNTETERSFTRDDLLSVIDLMITGASRSLIPATGDARTASVGAGEDFTFVILGQDFGAAPVVFLDDQLINAADVSVNAEGSEITVVLDEDLTFAAGPLTIEVIDAATDQSDSNSDLIDIVSVGGPSGMSVFPNGTEPAPGFGPDERVGLTNEDFPIKVLGVNLNDLPNIEIRFTVNGDPPPNVDPVTAANDNDILSVPMPILLVRNIDPIEDADAIDDRNERGLGQASRVAVIDIPAGGLPVVGEFDVEVQNLVSDTGGLEDPTLSSEPVSAGVVVFKNPAIGRPPSPCFIATAAYGTNLAPELDALRAWRDGALLSHAPGAAFVDAYYRLSPPVADWVAQHAWAAALVRLMVTPLVFLTAWPELGLLIVAAFSALIIGARRQGARPRRSS